jgi:hypothetical protein
MRTALLLVVGLLALLPLGRRVGAEGPDGPDAVVVTNFPEVQRVAGAVTVTAPIPQTRLETVSAVVSPAAIGETGSYTDAGVLHTAGFAAVTLGVAGDVQGRLAGAAPIGALLLPDTPEILGTFRIHGVAQFALRVEAQAAASEPGVFQSEQVHLQLGFPRYRVFFYNGTPRTSDVTLYAYLKSG